MTAVSCSVCGEPIDPRTDAHYQAEASGRRWCLTHGVVHAPSPQTSPVDRDGWPEERQP